MNEQSISLQRGEWHFRRLLDKLPAGAYTCDKRGLITYYNPHAVQLWGRAPKLNDSVDRFCGSFKLFSADGAPIQHAQCWMALALETDKEFNGHEIIVERPDGQRLTVLAHANPLRDDAGTLFGAVNVLVDISDRKKAEEALKQADRAKNEFLATLAHELRNPLAPIRNAVQVLHLKAIPSPELQWGLGVIDRQVQQMARLVDDLLDIARITGNKLELRKERMELAGALHAAVETSRPFIDACQQEFTVTIPSQPIYLDADPTRLAQIVANLLNNAAKYTEAGGRIWLTAERQGSDAVISVRDSGMGIPAEMLPRIFEMFTQVHRSDHPQDGLGIGLTLVKRLVNMHEGSITARSDGPGKGSEFVVRLPVLIQPTQGPSRTWTSPEHAFPMSSLRILVVDDNRDSAASMGMLLRIVGNDVRTANDGLEALTAAEEFQPDVVLLDIGLPKLNGYEVARRIRQQSYGVGMVLIATTGWGQDADRRRSKDAGFDHHLVKPLDPDTLLEMLAGLSQAAADSDGRRGSGVRDQGSGVRDQESKGPNFWLLTPDC
jgi:signal transduction histidine kinase/CheY-like chemotaxis protein